MWRKNIGLGEKLYPPDTLRVDIAPHDFYVQSRDGIAAVVVFVKIINPEKCHSLRILLNEASAYNFAPQEGDFHSWDLTFAARNGDHQIDISFKDCTVKHTRVLSIYPSVAS